MSIRRAQDERIEGTPDGLNPITEIVDVPDAPTVGSPTDVGTSRPYNNAAASVPVTANVTGGTPATYTVTSSPGGLTGSGTSPVTVTGLNSQTSYTFTAVGVNTTATGPASTASSSVIVTSVPDAPAAPTATNQPSSRPYNNGQASVSFSAPASGGKTITSYTVTSSPGGFTASGSASPLTVTGLASATSYTFTVTATNANGTGNASSASGAITATTVPQAPTIGTVTDGGTGTTVSIPYTAGATGGSTITNYQFVSSPATTTQTSTSNPYTFTGLTAGTAYTFTVAAINANGTSAASSASNSVTPITPSSFESIATATGTGSSGTITFSSIPNTYSHLQIRITGKATGTTSILRWVNGTFNNDNGSNYSEKNINGDGVTVLGQNSSGNAVTKFAFGMPTSLSTFANMQGVGIIDIIDYASTSKNKVIRSFSGGDVNKNINGAIYFSSGLWASTSAINRIDLFISAGSWTTTTTVALYGIKG